MKKKSILKSFAVTGLLTGVIGLTSFTATQAAYPVVEKFLQFNVDSDGGTYTNSSSFSGGYGSGTFTKRDTIYRDPWSVKLTYLTLSDTVTSGDPYYQNIFAENRSGGVVRYYPSSKLLRDTSQIGWSPNLLNPMSSTVHLMTDTDGGSSGAKQYRYVSIFKY
jgi:hypothetical protein